MLGRSSCRSFGRLRWRRLPATLPLAGSGTALASGTSVTSVATTPLGCSWQSTYMSTRSSTPHTRQESAAAVKIVEVGPRDGLQNEPRSLSVDQRVALVRLLAAAGCRTIEVGSFVSPQWVPAMADSAQVYRGLVAERQQHGNSSVVNNNPLRGTTFSCLVPNLRGWQEAQRAYSRGSTTDDGVVDRPDEIAIFAAASESFSQKVSHFWNAWYKGSSRLALLALTLRLLRLDHGMWIIEH
jgi:hypothetical protein